MSDMLHSDLTRRVIGSAFTVFNEIGPGFREAVYRNALAVELREQGISFQREVPVSLLYKGYDVGDYRADFVVESLVIAEIKAVPALPQNEPVQLLNYLRVSGIEVGLVLNFGFRKVEVVRKVFSRKKTA